ncbi:autophagy-related protein 27 [Rhodocollybia butyracea]|uniref:Autophagy-related protein 27 n=1 Tax=Rhodocollybia butyracea TaxID=206335 RepID=A0A9P5PZ34_9AGAR|nr:autophagy-related protein 27 [Rhodocollybia butyracea]
MILRRQPTIPAAIFFSLLSCYVPMTVADGFSDCVVDIGNTKFDLTPLDNEFAVNRTRYTPPTTMIDNLVFNLCRSIQTKGDLSEKDQCPPETRACLTKINEKQDLEDRIVAVIPVAKGNGLDSEVTALSSPEGLSILMHGPPYVSGDEIEQTLHIRLMCSQDASEPKFMSYNGSQVQVEWSTPSGCGHSSDEPNQDDKNGGGSSGSENVGSGIGWFFLVLLLAFAAYFALGAYHNYATYGASGMDLIPHRDFWVEVPYMISDVFSHLCSSVRPRRPSTRGGYIAV